MLLRSVNRRLSASEALWCRTVIITALALELVHIHFTWINQWWHLAFPLLKLLTESNENHFNPCFHQLFILFSILDK